jgi:predicted homoserine dehydrogenase-like protein
MAKTYGIGIIGAGNISAAYLRLAPLFKDLEVRAVADILPEAAQKRAAEFNVRAQTPDELLKNAEIDVVVNLTIPSTHFKVSMEAIGAQPHRYRQARAHHFRHNACHEPGYGALASQPGFLFPARRRPDP